jgi:hypothetical protein
MAAGKNGVGQGLVQVVGTGSAHAALELSISY